MQVMSYERGYKTICFSSFDSVIDLLSLISAQNKFSAESVQLNVKLHSFSSKCLFQLYRCSLSWIVSGSRLLCCVMFCLFVIKLFK